MGKETGTETDDIMARMLAPAGPYPWHAHENRQGAFMHRHDGLTEHRHVSRVRIDYYPFAVTVRSPEPYTNKGRGVLRAPSYATHCKHGHEYTPENTYISTSTGSRECRECRNEATTRYRTRREAEWDRRDDGSD